MPVDKVSGNDTQGDILRLVFKHKQHRNHLLGLWKHGLLGCVLETFIQGWCGFLRM